MGETNENEGYTYTRENGTVEHAPSIEAAHRMCPILGEMSLEQAGVVLKLQARVEAKKQARAESTIEIEQADEATNDDMFGMSDIFDGIMTSTEIFEKTNTAETPEGEVSEVETVTLEPITEKPSEALAEKSVVEKQEAKVEPIELEEAPSSDKKSYIEAWTPAEKVKAEAKPEVKAVSLPIPIVEIVPFVEKIEKTETLAKVEIVDDVEVVADVPQIESKKEAPLEVAVEIIDAEPIIKTETVLEASSEIPFEVSEPIEIKSEIEAPKDVFVIPIMIEVEKPVVQPEVVQPAMSVQENEETIPAEVDTAPEVFEEFTAPALVEKKTDLVQPQPEVIEIEDVQPETITAPVTNEIEVATDIPELIIEEPQKVEVITPVLEAEPIIEVITESTLESIDVELDQIETFEAEIAPEAEAEADPETEKDKLFIKNIEVAESAEHEEEDEESEQVGTTAVFSGTNTAVSKNKVRRLMGMFATLLHIEYTPV